MIYNVFEDGKNQNSIKQTYLDYLIQIELLNYLDRLKLIDNWSLNKLLTIIQIPNIIGNIDIISLL